MNRREKGWQYEELAASYLIAKGYQILERNYRIRSGEIDLIARDGAYLVFVEVKYRKNEESGSPLEAVDWKKQRTIIKVARYYLYHMHYGEIPCRFDVVGICGDKIQHIQNAFTL